MKGNDNTFSIHFFCRLIEIRNDFLMSFMHTIKSADGDHCVLEFESFIDVSKYFHALDLKIE